MTGILKALQLVAAIGLVGLVLVVFYPGSMFAFALTFALCYLAAASLAAFDVRIGIWLGLPFGLLTALFASYGVYRYVVNGFNFLTGTDGRLEAVHLPPYLFLLVAVASVGAAGVHLGARRWFVYGRAARDGA